MWEPKSLGNILIAELDEAGKPIIKNDALFHHRRKTTFLDQENQDLLGECMERDRRKIKELEEFKEGVLHTARSSESRGTFNEPAPDPSKKLQAQETAKEMWERLKLEGLADELVIFEMRECGFTNNEIGVAKGGTYRDGSNALAMSISKIYNKQKKLGP